MINNETKEKTIIKNKERVKLKKPKTYRVLLHNNPRTAFEAVSDVLENVFNKDHATAQNIMLECHNNGISQCFEGSKSLCQAKLEEANQYCKERASMEYPYNVMGYDILQFSVEEID